jgi:hypothetical protein
MGEHVTSSGGQDPGDTAVASQRTGRSQRGVVKSGDSGMTPDAARPSSMKTGPEFSFDPGEPLDKRTREVLMVIGALEGQGFVSSESFELRLRQMISMGLYYEAEAMAEGFRKVRTTFMQGFMG